MIKNQKGFTIIEILITTVIVAVLTTTIVYVYQIYVEQAYASEIIPMVKAIQEAQHNYYAEHGKWADSIFDLGLQIEGKKEYNFYPLTSNTGFRGNGHGISTKYFVYGTYVFEERDKDTGELKYQPQIHAYRHKKRFSNGYLDFLSHYGVSFYKIDQPVMDYRSIRFTGSDIENYVFKKIARQLTGNYRK